MYGRRLYLFTSRPVFWLLLPVFMYEKGGPETNPGFGVSFKRNDNVVVTRNNVVNKPSP